MSNKAKATAAATSKSLPDAGGIPAGMTQIGKNNAPSWKPEAVDDFVHGTVIDVNTVHFEEQKRGNKVVSEAKDRRVMTLEQEDGERVAVWESAALIDLFDQVTNGEVSSVFIRYDGLGKKKPGMNPPKLFTVAVA